MSRWKAAGIHLSISILIGLLVFALLFWVWYPAPYFNAAGGGHLTMILLGVDLVLGPLLTLILYKAGKKGLKFDLAMIAMLQLGALVYGLHTISLARPVFIVAAIDRFNVVAATDLDDADLAEGQRPEFRTRSWTGPRLVAARMPTDVAESNALLTSGLAGKDVQYLPKHYVPYEEEVATLLPRAKPIATLLKQHPQEKQVIDHWLAASGRDEASIIWLPALARKAAMTMLLDARTGAVLAALDIDPW